MSVDVRVIVVIVVRARGNDETELERVTAKETANFNVTVSICTVSSVRKNRMVRASAILSVKVTAAVSNRARVRFNVSDGGEAQGERGFKMNQTAIQRLRQRQRVKLTPRPCLAISKLYQSDIKLILKISVSI